MTITGTWEEIVALGDKLSGKEVRVTVLHPADTEDVIRPRNPMNHEPLERLHWQARRSSPGMLKALTALRPTSR